MLLQLGDAILAVEKTDRSVSYDAHNRIRKYAALRLRLARYSWQILSVVSINNNRFLKYKYRYNKMRGDFKKR